MKIFAENKGWVKLEPRHQMASGGEGTIYARDGDAFKLYHDQRDLAGKIHLLQSIDHPGVIAPKGVLNDEAGRFVGYWMKRQDGEALPNLFANAWRQDHGFGLKESTIVIQMMREIVAYAHARGALLVDGNEFNWLVDIGTAKNRSTQFFPQPMVLDVDSWQIGGFQATAIMPSIRDWAASCFTENTDWFSWAVVTFQIYTGIHPYKGTHPQLGKGGLEARMRANASLFDAGVRLNAAVRDINAIPRGLLDWYRAVFQDGVRSVPPAQFGVTLTPSAKTTWTASGDAKISITRMNRSHPERSAVPANVEKLQFHRLLWMAGRLFAVVNDSDRGLIEFDAKGFVKAQWPVIANATSFYRTAALSWYLGQPYLLAPAENIGIFPAPFLKSAGGVIDVFSEGGHFAMVLAVDKTSGDTFRYVARLNGGVWQEAECVQTEETFINAAGTGTGVVAHIPENGELRVYASKHAKSSLIHSGLIRADMLLESNDGHIVFYQGEAGYRLQLVQ